MGLKPAADGTSALRLRNVVSGIKLNGIAQRVKSPEAFLASAIMISLFGSLLPAASADQSNWYPASITLPDGLKYPCALTPLPQSLKGIPQSDRVFINHAYAMILKAAQAKTIMLADLSDKGRVQNAYSKYYYSCADALKKLQAEPTPKGLEKFRNQVIRAVQLQMVFFDKASTASSKGVPFKQLMAIPEGKQASTLLFAAWSQMENRYSAWDAATKDSINHHLCALDLF